MGSRGRTSTAALSVISSTGITVVDRPKPPAELTDEQAEEWRSIVNEHPADQFPRGRHSMLADHCRHTTCSRRIGELINRADQAGGPATDIDTYERLGRMLDRHTRSISSLAVRLGIAYSTAYEKRPAKGQGTSKKPWEFEG
jgi:hypothetical protein